ncbi:hypothetical protein PV328_008390 [Microctonus aethiopoides]|uniref:Uncharacterized protein n=1 Tax=Microctonus aethiopoides TaxID=144406 RepID=A0AA39FJ87_9HYME|nr:hypothetical protein PV328_008390 [Microctonus aethiopoides]
MSICTDVISPSSKPSLKTNAERKRELKKKVGTKLKSDSTKIVLRQEVGLSEYQSTCTHVRDEIDFLHEALSAYTKGGLKLLKKRYHELPLILGSDSNIPFDTDEELRCVQFLKKELNLDFVSGNTLETTRHGTSIGIFSRYVNHVTSDVHVPLPNIEKISKNIVHSIVGSLLDKNVLLSEQQLSQKGSVSTRASSNSAGNGSVPTQTSVSQGYRSARTIALHIQHQSVSQGYQ